MSKYQLTFAQLINLPESATNSLEQTRGCAIVRVYTYPGQVGCRGIGRKLRLMCLIPNIRRDRSRLLGSTLLFNFTVVMFERKIELIESMEQ